MRPGRYGSGMMDVRGTPGLGRLFAQPATSLAVALAGCLALTVGQADRRLGVATASAGLFCLYGLVRAQLLLSRRRRAADDWLRSSTGGFVAPAFRWRAEQLGSPRQRRMLARTLRSIEQSADERPLGRRRPLSLPAVREHRELVRALALALDGGEPVTPAGMLRVIELVTDGASPLWGTTKGAPLGDAISATLAILTPVSAGDVRAA
jgi:hypothetical protein